jgi:hypothetical protein
MGWAQLESGILSGLISMGQGMGIASIIHSSNKDYGVPVLCQVHSRQASACRQHKAKFKGDRQETLSGQQMAKSIKECQVGTGNKLPFYIRWPEKASHIK